jgi:hypothetical protein
MKESAPERGAGSDDPTGIGLWQDRPVGHLWTGCVRTGSSYPEAIDSNALRASGSSRSQSDRGLDSAERSPDGEPEARGRGKSERSERNDAGRSRSLSAGWREVAERLHAGEGTGHE